ncbi:VirK/YbjX family protein [Vibrio sp. S4M6]|uniref:VirK/YbjX family protein n=1 Tax=Vibrio sinus TaxID=2946865 RepID=UPI002029FF7B|nr:VirK/YbjX family protein [Vibrio sinus]MCL9782235.1 VirK/YbjX family protein [Vibrio sinus]
MFFNYVNYVKTLPRVAASVYPGVRGMKKFRYNARFCLWAMLKPNVLKQMQSLFEQPEMRIVAEHHPRIFEKPLKPFVCLKWRPDLRAKKISEHFQLLQQLYGQAFTQFYSPKGWTLLEVLDEYKILLCSGPEREGSLALKLVDQQERELFTLAFNISTTPTREMSIGALQGPGDHIEDRGEIIKHLTRGLHGLRPKALMLECLLILARFWQVETVLGITNKGHIYQAIRYVGSKRSSITYNYSDLWGEYGGEPISKHFYKLPVHPPRKDPSTLKKTKRRLYTKRYDWIATTEQSIQQRLNELTQ